MKGALAKGAHVGSAGCAVTQDRCIDAVTRAERAFAEVLTEVLRVDRLSVESHFFDELGADSLVMAKFCARVRKRGDLPPVSMQDIYHHPTIRSLAAALAAVAPTPTKPQVSAAVEAATPTSTREYILCGALQAVFFLAYSYAAVVAISEEYQWVLAGSGAVGICLRLIVSRSSGFVAVGSVAVAGELVLIGRWKSRSIWRLWMGQVRC